MQHLPKIELHLHLDCSLSYNVVNQLNPNISLKTYQKEFIAPKKCYNLADYISRAAKGLKLMQTPPQLKLVTLALMHQLKADNVIYAEIRFAPLQHLEKGLSAKEVVSVVDNAIKLGIAETGVEARLLLCTLRHFTEANSMKTVKLVKKFKNTSVVGLDLAADEAGFAIDNHIKAFEFAKNNKLNCTAHAGEASGADSVWETLKTLSTTRIGHGVRSIEDPELIDYLIKNNIHLEVCPTSNIQTDVFYKIENHCIDKLYNAGVSVGINTDARSVSPITLTSEYELLKEIFNWDKTHFLKCNLNAIEAAFISDSTKKTLSKRLTQAYL